MHPKPNDASRRRPRTGLRARSDPLVTPAESANSTRSHRLRWASQVYVERNASMRLPLLVL